MKIRTSANLFLVTTLLITVCGALAFSVIQVKSYIESNFYNAVPSMLDASSSELQENLAVGLALSEDLARESYLIDWFEDYEKDEKETCSFNHFRWLGNESSPRTSGCS